MRRPRRTPARRTDGPPRGALIAAALAAAGCWSGTGAPPGKLDDALAQDPLRVVSLAAGAAHTCALRADGAVLCWGSNEHAQLGLTGPKIGWAPARVPAIDDAAQIGAMSGLTCALRRTGAVRCWGAVRKGQPIAPSDDLAGLANVREIAVGHDQVIAALHDGSVMTKSLRDGSPARRVEGLGAIEHVTAGYRHACGLAGDGAVWCWGRNEVGELGDGSTRSSATPVRVRGLGPVSRIGTSQRGNCAWPTDGSVACWGNLGASKPFPEPFKLPLVSGLVGAAGGARKACGWFGSGAVECVVRGALGPDRSFVPSVRGVIQVVAGQRHFCALESGGRVVCWGSDERGELGDPRAQSGAPVRVPGLDDARDLVAAAHHACALRGDGSVWCWGKHPLGGEGTAPRAIPGITAARLTTNGHDVCAVDRAGTPRCFGKNLGWLGAGSDDEPRAITALPDTRELALGSDFACAIDGGGRVRCAGKNRHGELGDGTTVERREGVIASGVSGAREIAESDGLVCARLGDGRVSCWGTTAMKDGEAALFRAADDDAFTLELVVPNLAAFLDRGIGSPTPTIVAGLESITRLGRVGADLCALRKDGSAACWSRADRLAPKPAASLASAVALTGSRHHRCAVLADRRAACWGQNDFGELGAPGPSLAQPAMIPGLADVEQLAAGEGFTCARSPGGAVRCWGSNRYGELGDGGWFADRVEPVEVPRAALRAAAP